MTAPDGRTVVVVEVKARLRGGADAPPPEANVTPAKRRQLVKLTDALVLAERFRDRPVRIDVVAVEFEASFASSTWVSRLLGRHTPAALRHLPGAVTRSSVTGSRRGRAG